MDLTPRMDLIDKNFITNGAMEHWMPGTSFNVVGNRSAITANRYRFLCLTYAGTLDTTVSQSTDVPTLAESGYDFNYSLQVTVNVAEATTPSTAFSALIQRMEFATLGEYLTRPIKTSFWVKSSIAGDYTFYLNATGSGNYQFYKTRVTINNANTWEKKVISIPAMDNPSLLLTGTPSHYEWAFTIANGSGNTGDLNNDTWVSNHSGQWAVSSHVNLTETNGATINFTGIKMAVDNGDSTDQAFNLYGNSYDSDLRGCQRYYEIGRVHKEGYSNTGVNETTLVKYKVQKRAAASLTFTHLAGGSTDSTPINLGSHNTTESFAISEQVVGGTVAFYYVVDWVADIEL